MKKLSKITLNQFSKKELESRQMNSLLGGSGGCYCGFFICTCPPGTYTCHCDNTEFSQIRDYSYYQRNSYQSGVSCEAYLTRDASIDS